MVILSIDPGFDRLGYALFEKKVNGSTSYTYLLSGLIQTDKHSPHEKRLQKIYDGLKKVTEETKPTMLVIEDLFFFKNAKTVIKVSQSQGVVLLLAAQTNIPVKFLTPLQIKQTVTGYGTADKLSVQKMLTTYLKQDLSQLKDDETDAIACGLTYCFMNETLLTA